jgi:hypothetical protein
MAEPRSFTFSYQELAEILVKQQDIHEGLWGINAEFGFAATNIESAPGAGVVPAAMVPLIRLGIARFDGEVPGLTVDAAVVNPASEAASQAGGEENADEA